MKRFFIIFVSFISLSLVAFFSYQEFSQNKTDGSRVVFNNNTRKWEATNRTDDLDREKILKDRDNFDGFYNKSIIRGYYNDYDEKNNLLKVKSVLPFTQNNLFEIVEAKLNLSQTIYCVPENYTDPNNGRVFEVKKLTIPVKDGQSIFLPTERVISSEDFISNSNELTYLLIQLTKDFSKEETNYIQKIIVIGLCN